MKWRNLLGVIVLLFFGEHCASVLTLPPEENVAVRLTDQYVELLGEDTMSAFTLEDRSIIDCPVTAINQEAPRGQKARTCPYSVR